MNADGRDDYFQPVCDAPVAPQSTNPVRRMDRKMSDLQQSPRTDSPRSASSGCVEAARSEGEFWMHEFRNALGTIIVAAGAARGLLTDRAEIEVSIAMERIEDGCNRCLRLFRTMPPF